jgi:hypothetical protein
MSGGFRSRGSLRDPSRGNVRSAGSFPIGFETRPGHARPTGLFLCHTGCRIPVRVAASVGTRPWSAGVPEAAVKVHGKGKVRPRV